MPQIYSRRRTPSTGPTAGGSLARSQFTIGSTNVVIPVGVLFGDSPFTFEVTPDVVADPSVSIRVEVSFDGGTTYQVVGTFSQYASRRWVRSPEEVQPSHLMVYRATGTSVASQFNIGA